MSGVVVTQPDITLLLDLDGIIREATFADGLQAEVSTAWVGRPWVDTVVDGGEKVRAMLRDARNSGVSAYRMVTQRFPNGLELPVEYSTIRLGGKAGLIAIGRHQQIVAELQNRLIASQQAREQDYWKLREVETRYRLLFDNSSEVVLIIRAEDMRVVEANLAALRALGLTPGQDLLPELPAAEQDLLRIMLTRVREQGRSPGIVVHLGIEREAWTMRASLMTSEPGQVFLLQLAPLSHVADAPVARSRALAVPMDELVERLPDGMVVIDEDGTILRANPAFLDLVQVEGEGAVLGERLGRWLSRPGADVAVLLANVQRHRFVRLFATTLVGELSSELQVEISAAGNADSNPRYIGLLIRDVSCRTSAKLPGLAVDTAGRKPAAAPDGNGLLAELNSIADHLGQTSLPSLIKNTVGLVERYYIEAALERAGGNRTATAELLGLSRQSLYMKLNRYGLDTESQAAAAANG
jgi:transcriptional regulator PpsR